MKALYLELSLLHKSVNVLNHSGSERLSTEEIGDEMLIGPADDWATHTFGKSDLGDKRRTERLIKVAGSLASHIGQSLVKSCATAAEIEGAYRLLRNDKVDSKTITEAISSTQTPGLS